MAKDIWLPLPIEMTSPHMQGGIHMGYTFDKVGEIEIPACMASEQ